MYLHIDVEKTFFILTQKWYYEIVDTFQRVCGALGVEAKGREVRCNCPAHGGDSQSLSVRELPDGKVQITCFSQRCERDAILAAVGLTWQDLLPDNTIHRHGVKRRASKPTDKWTQERIGGEDVFVKWELVCAYLYLDEQGNLLYEKLRYRPGEKYRNAPEMAKKQKSFAFSRKAANGNVIWGMDGGWHEFNPKRRRWEYLRNESQHRVDEKPVDGAEWFDAPRRVLYDLPMLVADLQSGVKEVWVCEGEPDAGVLRRSLGMAATTADSGAGTWRREYTQFLAKFEVVVIVADRDLPGLKGAIQKRDAILAVDPAPVVRVVLPGEGNDAEEFVLKGGVREGFVEIDPEAEVAKLTESSPPNPPLPVDENGSSGFARESFWFNDVELAEAFVDAHGDRLRFCAKFGFWLRWTGAYWAEDQNAGEGFLDEWRKYARVQERVGHKMIESEKYGEKFCKKIDGQIKRNLSSTGVSSVEGLVKRIHPVPVSPDQLDQELDYLPVANGTIDLRRGVLVPADPAHLFTGCVNLIYDENADCPEWIKFLDESLGSPQMTEYMRMVVGYLLTGRTSEQKFWFFYGPPRSGKGTCIRILQKLMGNLSVVLQKQFIMKSNFPVTIAEHWARAKGKRLMVINEVDSRDRWDEAKLKEVTGEDMINARKLNENSYDFFPTFKMLAVGNEKPRVRGEDDAFWTRVLPVEFPNSRVGKFQDQKLGETLERELPGILLWAVSGAKDWYEKGLPTPEEVQAHLDEYKRSSDTIRKFLVACTDYKTGFTIGGQELFEAYEKYNRKIGNKFYLNKNDFGLKVKLRTDVKYKKVEKGMKLIDHALKFEEEWDYDAE
ncbi:hypothetical protein CCB80_02230 [Armatimonadetes bacterium Uphvl-Ar1]|nr:hypothetical protein CCB80_02230 [Armatimonadetes bacterium Uphvl-Ar1]